MIAASPDELIAHALLSLRDTLPAEDNLSAKVRLEGKEQRGVIGFLVYSPPCAHSLLTWMEAFPTQYLALFWGAPIHFLLSTWINVERNAEREYYSKERRVDFQRFWRVS